MGLMFSIFFAILTVGMTAILCFGFFRIAQREKLVEGILALPIERRNRYIAAERNLVRLFSVSLLPLFCLLIIFPLSLFFFLRPIFVSGTTIIVLMVIISAQEFLFRKWIVNRIDIKLKQRENAQ